MMQYIESLGEPVKMYLVKCKPATSMQRLRASGSTITPAFVKTTKTKARNVFLEYGSRFNGEILDTEGGQHYGA